MVLLDRGTPILDGPVLNRPVVCTPGVDGLGRRGQRIVGPPRGPSRTEDSRRPCSVVLTTVPVPTVRLET